MSSGDLAKLLDLARERVKLVTVSACWSAALTIDQLSPDADAAEQVYAQLITAVRAAADGEGGAAVRLAAAVGGGAVLDVFDYDRVL